MIYMPPLNSFVFMTSKQHKLPTDPLLVVVGIAYRYPPMTTATEAVVGTNMPRMYIKAFTRVPRPRLGLVVLSLTTDEDETMDQRKTGIMMAPTTTLTLFTPIGMPLLILLLDFFG
jgi:hypothetical protein